MHKCTSVPVRFFCRFAKTSKASTGPGSMACCFNYKLKCPLSSLKCFVHSCLFECVDNLCYKKDLHHSLLGYKKKCNCNTWWYRDVLFFVAFDEKTMSFYDVRKVLLFVFRFFRHRVTTTGYLNCTPTWHRVYVKKFPSWHNPPLLSRLGPSTAFSGNRSWTYYMIGLTPTSEPP